MTSETDTLKKLLQVVLQVSKRFHGTTASVARRVALGSTPVDVVRLALPPSADLYFIPSKLFPVVPPTILAHWDNGDVREYLSIQWPLEGTPAVKIYSALAKFVRSSERYLTAYGPDAERPLTFDPDIAAQAGWHRLLTDQLPAPSATVIARTRVDPALVDAIASCKVLMVGLGSVGSYIAEQLVRTGVGKLVLIDHDTVDDSNLSRTTYDRGNVGLTKVTALTRRLLNISPDVRLENYETEFQRVEPEILKKLFTTADLVIAATDDPAVQAQINSCAQHVDKPAIHVGLYKGAKGGEVAISVPGLTPCFRCQIGATRLPSSDGLPVKRATDYGSGRLQGEIALGCDIQHVSSAALKLGISLLAALKGVESPVADFAMEAIQRNLHMLTLGMEPEWWFYPEVFRDTLGQYAFQSVWLSTEKQDECPDCGPNRDDSDPFLAISGPIDTHALRDLLDGENR